MFLIGLVGVVLFLTCCCDIHGGALMLWVCLYGIIGVSLDFAVWCRRR